MFVLFSPSPNSMPRVPSDVVVRHVVVVPKLSFEPLFVLSSRFVEVGVDGFGQAEYARDWQLRSAEDGWVGGPDHVWASGRTHSFWDQELFDDVSQALFKMEEFPGEGVDVARLQNWVLEPNDALYRLQDLVEQLGGSRGRMPGVTISFDDELGQPWTLDDWDDLLFSTPPTPEDGGDRPEFMRFKVQAGHIRGLESTWGLTGTLLGKWEGDDWALRGVGGLVLHQSGHDGVAVLLGKDGAHVFSPAHSGSGFSVTTLSWEVEPSVDEVDATAGLSGPGGGVAPVASVPHSSGIGL